MAQESVIEYPTDFPIKIMGRRQPRLVQSIVDVVQRHAPDFDASTVEMRTSKKNNYLSVTCTVRATSRNHSKRCIATSAPILPSSWCFKSGDRLTVNVRCKDPVVNKQIANSAHTEPVTKPAESVLPLAVYRLPFTIRQLGLQDYELVWRQMKAFTLTRNAATPDELWQVE